ncbi:MAG: HEAT repeat domain-containing protein [Cytophagaceae bacterium]|nr:HEAT repeat domain-containing protein [Gemmatimonadaceae bacterium]
MNRLVLAVVLTGTSTLLAAQEPPPRPVRPSRPVQTPRPAIAPKPARLGDFEYFSELGKDFAKDFNRDFEYDSWKMLDESRWEMEAARAHTMELLKESREDMAWQMEESRAAMREHMALQPFPALPMVAPKAEWMAPLKADFMYTPKAWGPEVGIATTIRPAWAPNDQADSTYRQARNLLNQGEYRRAAAAFRDITARTPTSAYAADALYWQAFALYRIGGSAELRTALEALDSQRTKYPGARMQAETDALGMRIRGALASRGDPDAARAIRGAAGDSALRCDREEQAVRVEALNALIQSDAEGAMPVLQKVLARKDECSATLRRSAVFLIGSKRNDASSVNILAQVAKTDPSMEVRGSAMEWLARVPGEEALPTLEELARDTSDRVSRTAVRALVAHPSPRARTYIRNVVERSESPERLRLEALSAFDKERSTADDVTWMRALYGRTENVRIKARIVSALSNIGGPEVDQWMVTVARNADESSETRRYAMRRVGKTLPMPQLASMYDASSERTLRESLIEAMATRTEAEATDKLIDIVKTGTDPQLRRMAISALTRKKDPRTMRLLMEIIDK